MRPLFAWLAGLALVAWMLTTRAPGIVDPLNIQDHLARSAGRVERNHTIGQTFTARAPRLNALQVCWIISDDLAFAPHSRVTLHLRSRVDDATDLAVATLPLARIARERCSTFQFSPQPDSANRAYYFFLDAAETEITRGRLSVWASDDDVLPDGCAYANDIPTGNDLAFRAYSAPDFVAALETSCDFLARRGYALLIVALLVLMSYRIAAPRTRIELLPLAALALGALGVGIVQFAELPAPLWVDAYQHAADIQHILTRGHAPLDRLYHYGFHIIVALVIQLTGASIASAMILVGQLIVVQIGLSFFAFGTRWSGSAIVGLVSALCVWFLSPTPMYFLTWGRYPLLLGTAILPLALVAALDWLDAPRFDTRAFLFVLVTLIALASAHLRLLAFYALFLAMYGAWRRAHARRLVTLLPALLLGIGWLGVLLSQPNSASNVRAMLAFWSGIDLGTTFEILRSHDGPIVWTLAALGIIVARQNARVRLIVVWFSALVVLAALLTGLGAPLLEVPFVLLMGFCPAALIIGELVRVAREKIGTPRFLAWLEMTLGIVVVLLGAREMLTIINPTTILFTRADERAMQWIATNTPAEARFLVNAFEWYPQVYVPADGGAWIPYFTSRATVLPRAPAATAFSYVYLGRRAGVLRARDFADAPERYALVYAAEGIKIWRVK